MIHALARSVRLLTPKRRWAQFSLGSLILVVTVLCIALGTWAARAERQRRAVAAVEAFGGNVLYAVPEDREAIPKTFLRRWLPRDYLGEVGRANLSNTAVTDAGLDNLRALKGLRQVYLDGTQITDAGLVHLEGLRGLQVLSLEFTQVTDAALLHLRGLTGLRILYLDETGVTDAGLARLQQSLPSCNLSHKRERRD